MRLKFGPVHGWFSHRESFGISLKKLPHSSVNGVRCRRGRPAIYNIAILVDQELFKVPLYPYMSERR